MRNLQPVLASPINRSAACFSAKSTPAAVDPSLIFFAQPFANEGVEASWIIFAQPFASEGV